MINRRSFLRLVRNRVAAGVLCSGMLTDALERQSELSDWKIFDKELWGETYYGNITTTTDFLDAQIFNKIFIDKLKEELGSSAKAFQAQYQYTPEKLKEIKEIMRETERGL